jgi:hypothetical protein
MLQLTIIFQNPLRNISGKSGDFASSRSEEEKQMLRSIRGQKWPTVIFDLKRYNTSSKLLEHAVVL